VGNRDSYSRQNRVLVQTEQGPNFLVVTDEERVPFICKTAKGVSVIFLFHLNLNFMPFITVKLRVKQFNSILLFKALCVLVRHDVVFLYNDARLASLVIIPLYFSDFSH